MEGRSNSSKHKPDKPVGRVPDSLLVDDWPMESLISGARNNASATANVLDLWQTSTEEDDAYSEAVIDIFSNQPELLDNIGDWKRYENLLEKALYSAEKESVVSKAANPRVNQTKLPPASGRLADAERMCRRAVEYFLAEKGPADPKTLQTLLSLAKILDDKGEPDEATKIRRGCEIERLAAGKARNGLFEYREMALNLYLNDKPHEAEYIYKRLLAADFEIPGTLCHLARLYFMMNREAMEIKRVLADAWEKRHNASSYVIPRILFLQLLLELLLKGKTDDYIGQLKIALAAPGATLDWIINPVLDHVRRRLAPQYYYFMVALGKALSLRRNIDDLEHFPVWRETPAKP